ncbi:MAG TPA: S8 family serine peptidase [Thermoanaerobaculaceae bacterium]|nr:S8 family serine peptidase [Thermoanaerobaculaceae bacterium]HRS15939.1 S8 family serine peptidase [Thermoanaerobaculaceae bacterium]
MKTALTLAALFTVAGFQAVAEAQVRKADRPVGDRYIVVLKNAELQGGAGSAPGLDVAAQARRLAGQYGGAVRRTFQHALSGFVIDGPAAVAAQLATDPDVAFVEEDGVVESAGTQLDPASWGLDRIDQRALPLDGSYLYHGAGAGVDVYVIDSGIRSTHQDFGGRVDTGHAFTAIADGYGTEDCYGHGTAVAGVIGGQTYGVAKSVTLHPVRVLGCNGTGTVSDVIAGVDWVTSQRPAPAPRKKNSPPPAPLPPAVANMSLITAASSALDAAVQASIDAGITYVVAAGNQGGDACGYSPARLSAAITVGASNDADNVWVYSNAGPCVDLFAPGTLITSSSAFDDASALTLSGTSLAAPHVAGTAAIVLGSTPAATPSEVASAILAASTQDALGALPAATANRLLYSAFAGLDSAPVAAFTWTCRSRKCSFDGGASTDDHGISTYSWSFGDGTSGIGKTISHTFPAGSALFNVTLTVTDTVGQQSSLTKEVRF